MQNTISVQEAYSKALHSIYGLLAIYLPEEPEGLYIIHDINPTGDQYALSYYNSGGFDFELVVPGTQELILPDTEDQYIHFL